MSILTLVPKQMFFLEPMKFSWNFIGFWGPMKKNMKFHGFFFIFYEIRDTLLLLSAAAGELSIVSTILYYVVL